MNLERIELLLKLPQFQNFSDAARNLGLDKSKISRTVAQAEEYFGHEIYTKGRNKNVLTSKGKFILSKLKIIRSEFNKISNDADKVVDSCLFCSPELLKNRKVWYEDDICLAFEDSYPVSKGHTLVVTKHHYSTWFDVPYETQTHLIKVIDGVKCKLDLEYCPGGYNIGINCGEPAGQTVFHLHIHIIPRFKGDCENPTGGVRGVIPEKQNY